MYSDIFENGDSFSVLVFCPHVNGVFRQQKAGFTKRSPEWSYSLKNAGLSLSLSGQTKTDVFEYDDVIHHTAHALLRMIPSFHSFGLLVWVSENDSNTLRVDLDVYFFFLKTENKISPLKYPDTCGKGQP